MKKLRYLLLTLLLPAFVLTGCSDDDAGAPTRYTVAFQVDGGSAVASQTVTEGQKATRPSNPIKAGYIFADWYKDAALTTLYDFNAAVTTNVTLYAKWISSTVTTYTVTFDSNGGSAVVQQIVEEGRKATAPPVPTLENYDFAGWFRDAGLTATWDFDTDAVTADITLYAKWIPSVARFTVTFQTNGGSEVPPQNVFEGGLATHPIPPTKANEAFAGWYTESTLTTLYYFYDAVTADITLYARWEAVSHATLYQLLSEAWELNDNRYTYESFQPLVEARELATGVVTDPTPTPEQIVDAYEMLSAALAGLVEAPYLAVAKIDIYPTGIDGLVYVVPGEFFNLNAYGLTADGTYGTVNYVTFEVAGLEAWSLDGQDISVSTNHISFWPKDDLTPGATFSLIIHSMDAEVPLVVRSVTLKVAGTTELQDRFIAMVNALPEPSAIGYQHYDAIQQADQFYWQLPSVMWQELTAAYDKLYDCQEAYWELPERRKFSFSGNICTMRWWWGVNENDLGDPISFDFTASGAFPAGVYTERGWSEYSGYYYEQSRVTLRADWTFMTEYRTADDAQGTNATPWEEDDTGTYTFTGDRASGGVFYITYDDYYGSGPAAPMQQQPVRRGLHRNVQ